MSEVVLSNSEAALSKWKHTRLLERFEHSKNVTPTDVAILLQNQVTYNGISADVDDDISTHQFLGVFRTMSVPIVLRTMCMLKTPHLVKMTSISDFASSTDRLELKTRYVDYQPPSFAKTENERLQYRAEATALISDSIAGEIDRVVLHDLWMNAGSVAFVDPTVNDVSESIEALMDAAEEKCGHRPNWIVASTGLCNLLKEKADAFEPSDPRETMLTGVRFLGQIIWAGDKGGEQKLFEDTSSPEDELLMGYRGSEPGGYQFNPKLLLEAFLTSQTKGKVKQAKLIAHFNKSLPHGGGNFYARMKVRVPD